MENIINILPDSVANQIAAGEVIQRPASVVKELVENAIDAQATHIDVVLKDAGRTLIRITDNGKGMSPEDARLAFERHATSKIRQVNDLFNLHTMGFRGEALASIASVAQVELVTRRPTDELAWRVEVEGSAITNEEPTLFQQGSKFTVRNLFYNVPARRKFLGENAKELKAIRDEFIQIALVYPNLHFSLTHNDEVLYVLAASNYKQRILNIFGKRNLGQLNKQLHPVQVDTPLIKIAGFVGDPSATTLRDPMQYFFVNGRFIKHKSFRSAVLKAFDLLIPHGQQPTYFLYLEVETDSLDVNIHPTKTEVKFEHEQAIWPIVHAAVREALGKVNAVPSIDFDKDDAPDIRVFTGDREVVSPTVQYNPGYNPFKDTTHSNVKNTTDWEQLLKGFESKSSNQLDTDSNATDYLFEKGLETDKLNEAFLASETQTVPTDAVKFQLLNSYLVVQTHQSLLLIHQQRAHILVLFEQFKERLFQGNAPSQTLLFPEKLELDPLQKQDLLTLIDDLKLLGFNFECVGDEFTLMSIPADLAGQAVLPLVFDILSSLNEWGECPVTDRRNSLLLKLAKAAAVPMGRKLHDNEISLLVEQLFLLHEHAFTPDGKRIIKCLTDIDLKNFF